MFPNTETGTDLQRASELLNQNQVVAIPTETVYGLAGNALSEIAVSKIYSAKKRPLYNPLIVHIKSLDELDKYTCDIPSLAYDLFEKFAPGPLTIILPKKSNVSDLVTSGKPDVAIRIPGHPIALSLLEMLDFPLAAPSANPFGYISPTSAEHVYNQLNGRIPYILDGGICEKGIESTVIGFNIDLPVLYRLGALSLDELRKVVPGILLQTKNEKTPESPGMLSQHYSPDTKLYIVENIEKEISENPSKKIGTLTLDFYTDNLPAENQVILSENRNLNEAAQKLYAALHYLDALKLDCIFTVYMPENGLGSAINDRLKRAAAKFSGNQNN
jgi:L-threonylcarbamoyladenylate synthase